MKKFFSKLKDYGYIMSIAAAVIILLQALGIRVNAPYVNEVINAVCGVLIVLGIISKPKGGQPEETDLIDKKLQENNKK